MLMMIFRFPPHMVPVVRLSMHIHLPTQPPTQQLRIWHQVDPSHPLEVPFDTIDLFCALDIEPNSSLTRTRQSIALIFDLCCQLLPRTMSNWKAVSMTTTVIAD